MVIVARVISYLNRPFSFSLHSSCPLLIISWYLLQKFTLIQLFMFEHVPCAGLWLSWWLQSKNGKPEKPSELLSRSGQFTSIYVIIGAQICYKHPRKKVEVVELVGLVWYISICFFFLIFMDLNCQMVWYFKGSPLQWSVFLPLKAAVYSISLTFSWMRCERCNYVLPIQFPLGLKHREQKMHQLRQGIGRWYSEIDHNLAILGP